MKRCLWAEAIEDPEWGGEQTMCLLLTRVRQQLTLCEVPDPARDCSRYSEFDDEEEEE